MQGNKISRIGIIGAGNMGAQIAFRSALAGYRVTLYDKFAAALDSASVRIEDLLSDWSVSGRITDENACQARLNLLYTPTLKECVQDADFVIESVPENLDLKKEIFAEIDRFAPERAVIATHSSSLPASKIACVTHRPNRVFNINFSDPTGDPLVELMAGETADPELLVVGEQYVRSLDMVPILVRKEIMGFAFNRIWRAIKREALHLVADGYVDFEDIDRAWMLSFGGDMGPFGIIDDVGLDVVRDIEMQYFKDSGDVRDRPPEFLNELIEKGRLGTKCGWGFYSHPNPVYKSPGWLLKKLPWTTNNTIKLEEIK